MNRWCQNKSCPNKKTQGQIRGKKGFKYYQSNRASSYYFYMFCGQRCMDKWFHEHWQTCLNTVGEIDKQTIPLDDAWYVQHDYNYSYDNYSSDRHVYHLINKNRNIKQVVTRQQAQTPEQIANNFNWQTIDDFQAKELAVKLGLAS